MKQREPYTLFPRKMKSGKTVWYYRTYDNDQRTTARSTGQRTKSAARTFVTELLKQNRLVPQKNPLFRDYFADWWTWDKCRYVRGKRVKGARISPGYVENCRAFLDHHIMPNFGNKRISAISVKMIEDWQMSLLEKPSNRGTPLSPTSVNHILRTLKTMFKEAVRIGDFAFDPTAAVQFLRENRKEKSFLNPDEIHELFDQSKMQQIWNADLRHFTINLLAASSGMRMGEIQALQIKFVYDGYLHIEHSWAKKHGLSDPKYGAKRDVPVPSKTLGSLKDLIHLSPYQEPEDFVFWGIHGKKPVDQKTIDEALYDALSKIGISEEDRVQRNVTFHSWRHFFNTYFRTKIPDVKLMQLTGHRTRRMADHYTHFKLDDFRDVLEIQENFFKGA